MYIVRLVQRIPRGDLSWQRNQISVISGTTLFAFNVVGLALGELPNHQNLSYKGFSGVLAARSPKARVMFRSSCDSKAAFLWLILLPLPIRSLASRPRPFRAAFS